MGNNRAEFLCRAPNLGAFLVLRRNTCGIG
jgi:hypothetical protein